MYTNENSEIFMKSFYILSAKVVLLSFVCLSHQPLFADSAVRGQGYFARKVPSAGANCHEQAKDLGRRFTMLTGLAASASCESSSESGHDFLIRYEASEPLEVLTSATEIGFPGQGYEFSSKAECERELPGEVEIFRSKVGHEPLLSFCKSQENYYGRVRWALIVEGFAKLEAKNAWASSLFPGLPKSDMVAQIKNDVKMQFTDNVTSVRHVFLQDDEHGHLRLTVNYYGKYDEQLKAFSIASIGSMAHCLDAYNEMERIKNQTSSIKTLNYCVDNPYDNGADLVIVADVTRWYSLRQSAETFKSYDECATARAPLLDVYRSNYPQQTLGGFCTEWGSNWKVNILELSSSR
jgi:hypothetical protein